MSTSRDSAEEREGEMMAIDEKPSNVSMGSMKTSNSTVREAESRDDSGASEARLEATDERQGATKATTKTTTTTKAAQKKSAKGRQTQARQLPQDGHPGHFQQQRGAMAYHAQIQAAMHANANGQPRGPYGAYGYGSAGAPHDPYRGAPHHPQYSMPPLPHHPGQQAYGAGPGAPFHPGQHHHPSYGAGPYAHPPHMYSYHGGPMQHHHQQPRAPVSSFPSSSDDTASIGSNKSKGSKSGKSTSSTSHKKRTIDGVDQRLNVSAPPQGMTSAFTFRRTHSNASTSSTVTAGNNTSTETPLLTDDSPQKARNHLPPLSSRPDHHGSISMLQDDSHKQGYHRRDFSAASTTSSLSVGGLSLSSYETRGKN
jgi:hypothetical protein